MIYAIVRCAVLKDVILFSYCSNQTNFMSLDASRRKINKNYYDYSHIKVYEVRADYLN